MAIEALGHVGGDARPEPVAQSAHVGRLRLCLGRRAGVARHRPAVMPRGSGHRDDIGARHQPLHSRAEPRQQLVALVARIAIRLVQDQQYRARVGRKAPHGTEFDGGEVALDHEQQQVRARRHVPRDTLPFLAADLIDAGGIDKEHAAGVFLSPGGPAGFAGLAMQRAGGEALLA